MINRIRRFQNSGKVDKVLKAYRETPLDFNNIRKMLKEQGINKRIYPDTLAYVYDWMTKNKNISDETRDGWMGQMIVESGGSPSVRSYDGNFLGLILMSNKMFPEQTTGDRGLDDQLNRIEDLMINDKYLRFWNDGMTKFRRDRNMNAPFTSGKHARRVAAGKENYTPEYNLRNTIYNAISQALTDGLIHPNGSKREKETLMRAGATKAVVNSSKRNYAFK